MHQRFWAIVDAELKGTGLGISPSCRGTIDDQIRTIVDSVGTGGWQRPQPDVEADFRRLIREMIRLAKARNYQELHEDTFYDARPAVGILCPGFWPFC